MQTEDISEHYSLNEKYGETGAAGNICLWDGETMPCTARRRAADVDNLATNENGQKWAFMRTYTFGRREPLIRRTRIIQTPWFGVFLHKHYQPDQDSELHDHPWPFVSVILRGGYLEEVSPKLGSRSRLFRCHNAGSFHLMTREKFHSIRELFRFPTWTLIFVGRRQGSVNARKNRSRNLWGFDVAGTWVSRFDYLRK